MILWLSLPTLYTISIKLIPYAFMFCLWVLSLRHN